MIPTTQSKAQSSFSFQGMEIELQEITRPKSSGRPVVQWMQQLFDLAEKQLREGELLTGDPHRPQELDSLSRKVRQVVLGKVETYRARFYADNRETYYALSDEAILFVAAVSRVLKARRSTFPTIPEAIFFQGLDLLATTEAEKVIQALSRFENVVKVPEEWISQFPKVFQQSVLSKLTAFFHKIPDILERNAPETTAQALKGEIAHLEASLGWMQAVFTYITSLHPTPELQSLLLQTACKNLGDSEIKRLLDLVAKPHLK